MSTAVGRRVGVSPADQEARYVSRCANLANLFKPRFKLNAEATAPGTGPRPAERLACLFQDWCSD